MFFFFSKICTFYALLTHFQSNWEKKSLYFATLPFSTAVESFRYPSYLLKSNNDRLKYELMVSVLIALEVSVLLDLVLTGVKYLNKYIGREEREKYRVRKQNGATLRRDLKHEQLSCFFMDF